MNRFTPLAQLRESVRDGRQRGFECIDEMVSMPIEGQVESDSEVSPNVDSRDWSLPIVGGNLTLCEQRVKMCYHGNKGDDGFSTISQSPSSLFSLPSNLPSRKYSTDVLQNRSDQTPSACSDPGALTASGNFRVPVSKGMDPAEFNRIMSLKRGFVINGMQDETERLRREKEKLDRQTKQEERRKRKEKERERKETRKLLASRGHLADRANQIQYSLMYHRDRAGEFDQFCQDVVICDILRNPKVKKKLSTFIKSVKNASPEEKRAILYGREGTRKATDTQEGQATPNSSSSSLEPPDAETTATRDSTPRASTPEGEKVGNPARRVRKLPAIRPPMAHEIAFMNEECDEAAPNESDNADIKLDLRDQRTERKQKKSLAVKPSEKEVKSSSSSDLAGSNINNRRQQFMRARKISWTLRKKSTHKESQDIYADTDKDTDHLDKTHRFAASDKETDNETQQKPIGVLRPLIHSPLKDVNIEGNSSRAEVLSEQDDERRAIMRALNVEHLVATSV